MLIASFDIGKKNFAFCIEDVDEKYLSSISTVKKKFNKDGSLTEEFKPVIDKVRSHGKLVLLENIDITQNSNPTTYLDPVIFINMMELLDMYKDYWDRCDIIIIEQQMGFGSKKNLMAVKLGQHCFSYFIFNYKETKHIIEFPAYYKTKILGASKKMTKYQRKKWAVIQAVDILLERDDKEFVQKITKSKKKDDLSDVIVQLNSFKYLYFIEKYLNT